MRDFDLEIADGEFMVLVGPSGCGKTTLLRMIAGLEEITAGTIEIGDRVVNDLTPKARDIAMVFQNYALYPHMTVAKNMGFALKRSGVPAAEIREKVERTARLLGIDDQLQRKPSNLSGGQRQRVAMGRAIVRDPQAFLMDEPLSNLDAKLRIQMRAEIVRIQRRLSTTTVYVTHDQTEAMTLGDRLAVMRDGVLQQVGTPSELYERPRNLFVAGFIGAPAMNLLAGELDGDALKFPLGTVQLPGRPGGAPRPSRRRDRGDPPRGLRGRRAGGRARRDAGQGDIDVLESTGSDIYAHLSLDRSRRQPATRRRPLLRELAAATSEDDGAPPVADDVIARVDSSSALTEGRERGAVAGHLQDSPVRSLQRRAVADLSPAEGRLSAPTAPSPGPGAGR